MHHPVKIFFFGFLCFCSLFSFPKLYADRVVDSQKLVTSLYNDLVATSVKEMSIDEQKTELEKLFQEYVDIPIIARAVLGKSWRNATTHQKAKFVNAFKNYVSIKYGRQFSEFRGTTLEIVKSRDTLTKAGVLVSTVVVVPGNPSLKVVWQVSDGSGSLKLIDLRVEGISMLSTERQEFRSRLKKLNGSLDKLILEISKK
ncbi:MAG: ABC transporter substrate-binding protein [Alphaproteobacteria bacterium]|jgi:phospholipid transport system substrate-binding protein|nr:MAG: ABC transporter substrate-binding protein [Alphaproteobacteria bacterium]